MTKIIAISKGKGHVCVKFVKGDKEVSLALDDSCGTRTEMFRTSMFDSKENFTEPVSLEQFVTALNELVKE